MSKDVLYARRQPRFTEEQKAKAAERLARDRGIRATVNQRYKTTVGRASESSLQLAIGSAARRMGYIAVKLRAAGARGVPDLLLISPRGFIFFMEVKVPGGRLSESQKLFHAKLEANGATVAVVYGLVGALELLKQHA